jgi:hypothetical protein
MQKDGEQPMDEADFERFDTLNKKSSQINSVISIVRSQINETKSYLVDNNLLAGLFDVIRDVTVELRKAVVKTFRIAKRVAILAAKEINKKLPESTKKNLLSFFGGIAKLLPGGKES